jgi:hypothetical protein
MIIKPPVSYSFTRVIKAWDLRYNFNIGNSLRCIYDIATKGLTYGEIETLIEEAYNSIDTEIVELDMGFDYIIEVKGNPQEQLFTPTLKGIPELNLFYNPYCVFIAWFPHQPEDFSLLEINMILYLIRMYSEIFKMGDSDISYTKSGGTQIFNSQDRVKKMRTTLLDIQNELKTFLDKGTDIFIKMEKLLYKRGIK